nr:hypothetical protein FFPRI1PSEUD_21200 [Pseudomonas sp. FFPRI_1]
MIEQLVADLPEVYQPIFGHSDFSDHASRPCADRLEVIAVIYDALQTLLGRPLKILDLGCAQGYFSLSLASRGASVRGVDFLDKNIFLCNALAEENPQFNVTFEIGRVEDVIDQLQPGQYDLILGLSVFHHVIHERGVDEVKRLFQNAAVMCGALILEVALREGDLYWASAQPEDPLVLLEAVTFVREAARCKTHLTSVERPLYVASNNYWIVQDKAGMFDTWSKDSHALANNTHEGSRRYFFGSQEVIKKYHFVGPRAEHNRLEFFRERMFLSDAPPGYPAALPIVFSETEREGWVVMQRLQGNLLLDVLSDSFLDRKRILKDILEQLVELEVFGFYHNDVRAWNILVAECGGAYLIDYGAISQEAKDCVWPHNVYLAFMVFVHELATGHVADPSPIRQISIAPFKLPQPFRSWASGLWALPAKQWSFRLMLEHLNALGEQPTDGEPEKNEELWMQAIEEAIDLHSGRIRDLGEQLLGKSHDMDLRLESVRDRVESVAEFTLDVQGSMKDFERRAIHSEAIAEQLRLQLQDASQRIQSAERRSHETELALRESIGRAAQADARRVSSEYLSDSLREQFKQSANDLFELCKGHQKIILQFESEQRRRLSLEAQIENVEERACVLEAERDIILSEAGAAQTQIEYLENHPKHLGLQIKILTGQLVSIEEYRKRLVDELNIHQSRTVELDEQLQEVRQRLAVALSDASREQANEIEAAHQQARTTLDEALANAHHWYAQAIANEKLVTALHKSTSWRITWPMRVITRALRWTLLLPVRLIRAVMRRGAVMLIRYLLDLPALSRSLIVFLKRYPRLYAHLRGFARHRGLIRANQISTTNTDFITSQVKSMQRPLMQARDSYRDFEGASVTKNEYSEKRIAVLAPISSSGVAGGAERFYSGLVKALQAQGCEVELICLPVDEATFDGIKQGYQDFAELDLSEFDLVISTKAPSYAVKHPNHILYLVHTVRVFYDMFDDVFPHANEEIKAQQRWVHHQDGQAFSQVKHRFSIGAEVSKRLVDWNDYDAEVIHPPMDIDGLYNTGTGDYFFMPGRLHEWKRVDLAIRAIKHSSLAMKLVVSGEGDAAQYLRELADGDARIEFLGRVDDETLKRLYAGALAVPFLPIREDYGYITLEAFASGKPVITCTDSGEPQAIVEHGVSGFVCLPQPESVCQAFERLWLDRTLATRMGKAGQERVSGINWVGVSNRLLQAGFPEINTPVIHLKPPLKVAVLDMQPIIPAVGGGRLRLLGLYHALGEDLQVRYVGSYDWPGEKYRRHTITPMFEEIDVPLSAEHHAAAEQAAHQAGGKTVIDMLFSQQAHLSPDYLKEVFDAVEWAEVVVFSHPWVAPLVSDNLLSGKTVVYDSQNVESELRSQLLNLDNPFEQSVLDEVIRSEKLVGDRADIVLACSQEDIDGFFARFGWSRSKLKLVPNGVFSNVIRPPTHDERDTARKALGFVNSDRVAFFIGSNYAPNIEAGLFIVEELAKEHPNCIFAIGGGVCSRLPGGLPKNVRRVGFLEEEDKVRWLHASDFAINPMFSGSGTNIKMFDFMSAGLPIVATHVGARGIVSNSTDGIYLAEREDLSRLVGNIFNNRDAMISGGHSNRRFVEEYFSWESISPALGCIIRSANLRRQGSTLLSGADTKKTLRVAHLSTVGLKCGIGEYTRKLISVYQNNGVSNFILGAQAANEQPDLAGIGVPVEIVWFFDNVTWKNSRIENDALENLLKWEVSHLVIQYHPGYYSAEALSSFVESVIFHDITVSVIVHNFVNESASAMCKLNKLGVTLFSHRTTEVLQAKLLGVVLEKIPLAMEFIQDFPRKTITHRDWIAKPPVITTTGFLRKHKGVTSLIRAMSEVLRVFPGAQLIVQCALYPSEDSRQELKDCELEVARLGLQDSVKLDTRFLDKNLVLKELAKADLAVLPYEQSNEGGSATAADCMCVGLPLIVSTAEIFDEVRSVAFTVSPDVAEISQGILNVLSDSERYAALVEASIEYAKENSWENIAGVFLST